MSALTTPLFLTGNLSAQSSFTASDLTLSGTIPQTVTAGTSSTALTDLTITNTAGTGESSPSVTFTNPLTTAGTFTMSASTSAAFAAGATSTFTNVDWQGATDAPVGLYSTSPGTAWQLDISGAQLNVEYVAVADSDASPTFGGVVAASSTDLGNNTNWIFNNDAPLPSTIGPFTFDADNDADEAAWTFVSDNGTDGLNPAGTGGAWSHETDDTGSSNVGPTSGQGGNPDGYVYTEATGATAGDTFTMTYDTPLDAAANDWHLQFYWNQRGDDNQATVAVQTNENGAGWVTQATYGENGPDVPSGGTQRWNQETLDLTDVISDASTELRFLVTLGSTGTTFHNDFGLDTISFNTVQNRQWNPFDYTQYDTITIKHENIDESLTDFPVYVDLADLSASFWATTPSAASLVGTDIRVTTDDGTPVELPRELVAASSSAETGELHFKADFINKDADTSFRIYYNGTTTGDYLPDATYGAQGMWSNGYQLVAHLEENADGSPADYRNSVDSNTNGQGGNGTSSAVPTQTANARLGGFAQSFDGGDFIGFGDNFDQTGDYTLEALINPNNVAADTRDRIIAKDIETFGSGSWALNINDTSAGTLSSFIRTSGGNVIADVDNQLVAGQWQYIISRYQDSSLTTFHNYFNNTTVSGNGPTENNAEFFLGRNDSGSTNRYSGLLDEVRVSSVARNNAWLKSTYLNQSTTTDFYSLGAGTSGTGSTTLSDHDATQVDNAFDFQNKTNEPLFAFKLTPESGTSTITELTLEVRGVQNLDPSDFSNIRLLRDLDNDAQYDASDELVTIGTLSLGNRGRSRNSAQQGTIIFPGDFLSTTTQNYLVTADWNYPENGSFLTVDLRPDDIEAIDANVAHLFTGNVDHVQHSRNNRGGGGGSSAAVGPPAPAGDGVVSGGGSDGGGAIDTNTDGDTIGNEGDFFWPTAGSGDWQSIANAYDQIDGTYATTGAAFSSDLSAFNDSVPGSDTIEGIAVKLEGAHVTTGQIAVELSFDGGSTYTSSGKVTSGLSGTDQVVTLGGPSDTWGRSWSPGEFSDANFRVRITGNSLSGGEVRLDAIQVRVYHQASGGSSGGGGAI